jgi:hypothetical protein
VAVAHDAQTRFPTTDTTGFDITTGDRTFAHTPSGTPAGAVVVICRRGSGTSNPVSGVLYGGVAMTLSESAVDTTEAGNVWIYTLVTGVPSGTQTVTLQSVNTTDQKWVTCSTVTAGTTDTAVVGTGSTDTTVSANPSTDVVTSASAMLYGAVHGGLADPTGYAAPSGYTAQHTGDYGALSARTQRSTNAIAAGTNAFSFTAASDDWCIAAVALGEAANAFPLDAQPAGFAVTGAAASSVADRLVEAASAAFAVVGFAADLVFATSGTYSLDCQPAAYAVTGAAATVEPGPMRLGNLARGVANPVLRNGPETYDDLKAGPSSVVKIADGDYRQWYEAIDTSRDPDGAGSNVYAAAAYATSTDGVTWTKQGVVLEPTEAWENSELCPTCVLWDGSQWVMYYHAGNNTGTRKIGRATSPNLTAGGTWTKYASNPIVANGGSGEFDESFVADCKVIRVGASDWRMWYVGRDAGGKGSVGYATSSDGVSWTKQGQVLAKGTSGAWDDDQIMAFSVVFTGSVFRAWYMGAKVSVSFAKIGYAQSPDGATWTKGTANPVLSGATDEDITDSIDAYDDGDGRYRVVYGQYDLVGDTLRGKGSGFERPGARVFGAATSDRIDVTNAGIEDAFTLLMWAYPTTRTIGRRFWEARGNDGAIFAQFLMWNTASNGIRLDVPRDTTAASADTTDSWALNTWWCVAATYDETDGPRVFRGQELTAMSENTYGTRTVGAGATKVAGEYAQLIGNRPDDPTLAFQGRVGMVVKWNVRLTATEVEEARVAREFGDLPQPGAVVGFWRMADGASPEPNEVAGGVTGTVTGATYLVNDGPPAWPAELTVAYTLDCQPGSYSVTGTSSATVADRLLSSDPGSHTVTGVTADLVHTTTGAFSLDAQPGTYTLTGSAASPLASRTLAGDPGVYTATGLVADLVLATPGAYAINADPGGYTLTGAVTAPVAARILTADPGSYVLTGVAAALGFGRSLNAAPAAYTVTGTAGTLLAIRLLATEPGAYTVTGATTALRLEGQAPNLDEILTGWIASPNTGGRIATGVRGGIPRERIGG